MSNTYSTRRDPRIADLLKLEEVTKVKGLFAQVYNNGIRNHTGDCDYCHLRFKPFPSTIPLRRVSSSVLWVGFTVPISLTYDLCKDQAGCELRQAML